MAYGRDDKDVEARLTLIALKNLTSQIDGDLISTLTYAKTGKIEMKTLTYF